MKYVRKGNTVKYLNSLAYRTLSLINLSLDPSKVNPLIPSRGL